MGLELPGIAAIETPAEARSHARRWARMAREIDTPDAPDEAKTKARELRQRVQAANDWARRQEDALAAGQTEHDNVVQLHPDKPEQHRRRLARRAGHTVYQRAKPPAMRLAVRGRQHFFQGAKEPFGPVGSGWDLAFEALGLTLAVIVIADVVKAPRAISETSSHLAGAIQRAVEVRDPITGQHASWPGARAAAPSARPTLSKATA